MQESRFKVGQIVHHQKFGYRGVVIGIDETFSGTNEWYERVARSHPPRDRPWYHILVNQSDQETYVAERHLELDPTCHPIVHPLVSIYFDEMNEGTYVTNRIWN